MKGRRLCAWAALFMVAVVAAAPADTLREIDNAVAQLAAFVRRTVPDQEGTSVAVVAFTSDTFGPVVLGNRLQSELELSLAASYSRTRVVAQPGGPGTYTVSGELQSYPGTVRVICRITRPDGSLGGGSRADIPASPELTALLGPSRGERPPGSPASPGGRELHGRPGAASGDAAANLDDPLEPDDIPGFEVQVLEGQIQLYDRAITRGDIDRFRFYAPGEITAVFELQTAIDLQLLLFRDGQNIPFEVAGGRGSEGLRLAVELSEGYYIAEVLAYDFNVTGRYTLAIDLSGGTEELREPEGLREQAAQISPGDRQLRFLAPGEAHRVDLAYTAPGFYAVYTEGLQIDTRIEIVEQTGRTLTADEDSGAAANAYAGVFLGVRRAHAAVTGKGALNTGTYILVFERIDPPQVYPSSRGQAFARAAQPRPLVLQLRVLQPGRYLVRASAGAGAFAGPPEAPAVRLFALPAMRELAGQNSLYVLAAGDHLLSVSFPDDDAAGLTLCIAAEAEAEECLRSAGGGPDGRSNR